MKHHWKILLWMVAGIVGGGVFQLVLDAPAHAGLSVASADGGARVERAVGPSAIDKNNPKVGLSVGHVLRSVTLAGGRADEEVRPVASQADVDGALADSVPGDVLWFEVVEGDKTRKVPVTLKMAPDSSRATWLTIPILLADIFMALLKMLIVPLVLTSIISGVAGVGAMKDLRRMGLKTFAYYFTTSMLAIFTGQLLVNIVQPGTGAELGLPTDADFGTRSENFWEVFVRMVPTNVFDSLSNNSAMLAIIFFGLLFGISITRSKDPYRTRVKDLFESGFAVMMSMAELVLKLIPYGVFFLMIKVVGQSGFGLFVPLLKYMVMIAGGLAIHGFITLPLVLRCFAGIHPVRWARTMGPALMTAFSASSSSMTLPVTLECVESRGKVSNKTSSFVLPLGATINMDGTALYECAGVIFLCQFYASAGVFELTFGTQVFIVMMALFASVGAAGIPSAGLILMLTILSALELPLEGAAILLAVDRPLDMMRTAVNVWSDSCGAAVIAKSEGEDLPDMIKNVAASGG